MKERRSIQTATTRIAERLLRGDKSPPAVIFDTVGDIDALARFEGELFKYNEGKWSIIMSGVTELNTLEDFLGAARKLRDASEEAEARFLVFLREFEVAREDLWKTGGVVSYESFLQTTQLINPARYRNFCAGAKLIKDPIAAGSAATQAAASFKAPTTEALAKFEENAAAFREVHGVAPSEQTAKAWVKQLDDAGPKVVRQASRLRQLEAENQALRAENKELRRKLAKTEKELERHRLGKVA